MDIKWWFRIPSWTPYHLWITVFNTVRMTRQLNLIKLTRKVIFDRALLSLNELENMHILHVFQLLKLNSVNMFQNDFTYLMSWRWNGVNDILFSISIHSTAQILNMLAKIEGIWNDFYQGLLGIDEASRIESTFCCITCHRRQRVYSFDEKLYLQMFRSWNMWGIHFKYTEILNSGGENI